MDPSSDDLIPNVTPPPDSSAVTPEPPLTDYKEKHTIYALQVRAFLEASEDVDIDADTVQDILEGFPEHSLDIGVDVEADEGENEEEADSDISGLSEFGMEGV